MRTTAIINQKGGCGKTTTAIHLASELARRGRKTLLVDMDPQSHCALGLSVPEDGIAHGVADLLGGNRTPEGEPIEFEDCLWRVSRNLDLLPSSLSLAGAERQLANATDRDRRLAGVLARPAAREAGYTHCIIDCPPSIGLLTFNALLACQEVIIPVETGYFALQGAIRQARTIDMLARRVNHRVRFSVLPTLHRADRRINREILVQMKRHFGEQVLPLAIHEDEKLREAAGFGQAIGEYDAGGSAAADFAALADWMEAHPPEPAELLNPLAAEEAARRAEDTAAAVAQASHSLAGSRSNPAAAALPPRPSAVAAARTMGEPTVVASTPPAPVRLSRAAELVARTRELSRRNAASPANPAASLTANPAPSPATDPASSAGAPAGGGPAVMPAAVEKLCGCRSTRNGVLFIQPGDAGERIAIAGGWNGWDAETTIMTRNADLGVWQALVRLPAGRHAYRLVIDGRWSTDPHNDQTETNPLGEANNLVIVPAEPPAPSTPGQSPNASPNAKPIATPASAASSASA